jgi:peptide/nickel transport system substrate-binding protein
MGLGCGMRTCRHDFGGEAMKTNSPAAATPTALRRANSGRTARRALLGVFLGIACAAAAPSGWSAETPQRGGTLIVGNGDEPRVLAPNFSANIPDVMVGCMIYDGLVRFAPGFEIVPGLAKSWEISPDGLDYTFHLHDAKWTDGQALTSEDVKFSLTEISAKYGPKFIAAGKAIDHIDTPDPLTVKIRLKQTFGPFLFSLVCEQNSGIMPKHIFAGSDILKNPALTATPIGSGPFKMSEWVRGDHLTVLRNDTHWMAGQPYLDRIILRDIPDASARILALQAGELDFIEEYYFPLNFYKVIAADPKFQLKEVGYGADDLITFNTKNAPVDNPAVRRALLVATDREYIHKNVDFSLGRVAVSSIDSRLKWAVNPAVNYDKMYPFDPNRAKAMLDEAGFKSGPDGTRFTIRLVFRAQRAEEAQMAQIVQRNWQGVGVKVNLVQTEGAVYDQKIFKDYDFDATILNYSTGGAPALGVSRIYTTEAINNAAIFNNASRYSNPEVDELFAKGRDAPNQAERAQAYFKVQELIARDLPTLTIHEQAQIDVARVQVMDPFLAAHYPWWGAIWMKK